ncbi:MULTISPECIES: winged helix-turn-helix domain-containing protein [unclassified Janthinobacterium]|uniref:ATP-binding protein n=1 Tax=unclassified Janthinobacterium TaxID=2610881 RepID=UPI0016082A80|nr:MULTISPECIES: winged helix-turn-helix domain-containing protein [unclassified Janthinobacterium]MBB5609501.1 putative ATPase [Janthinobacterium sp. S3T4]MBB5614652.1 putative ATPase [Janthinobacterium sp. S3M3]
MNSTVPAYVFGPFRLLPLERVLFDGERALRLGSRAMDLLLALLERAGEIVDKQELLATVWPNAVVDDATLRVHLAALRKVLGDGRDGQRYITTIPGRGYGFLAPLSLAAPVEAAPGVQVEPQHNLPVVLTRMVGRGEAVQAMAANLLQLRLMCIVGPGGIGKTTVAIALAARVLRRYTDGVCFVDLAPLAEGHLVPLALATALGVAVPAHEPMPALLAYLQHRHMLIVLDNCEHVIAAAAALADALLKGAPLLHLLATSREPLRISSEHLQRLPALELPPADVLPDALAARHFAAVQLFCERCAAVVDGFVLADADVAVVTDICRRLDGIPLALELAAGRVGHFGLHELQRQLHDRLRLLTRGPRNSPLRHQTLRATLDWSYGLLDEEERSVLLALSVFKSRFRLESAAAVVGRDVADTVADLAAKSLLSIEFCCRQAHYRLLDTTRAYAAQRLADSSAWPDVSLRYARHCAGLADTIADDWESMAADTWSTRYCCHVDDLRSAIDWAFDEDGDVRLGIRLTIAAQTLFYQLSLMDEYRSRVRLALKYMELNGIDDVEAEVQLRTTLGHLLMHTMGVTEEVVVAFQRGYVLAMSITSVQRRAEAVCGMWIVSMALADFFGAAAFADQFGALCDGKDDPTMLLIHARMASASEHMLGRHAAAAALARAVLAHPQGAGHTGFNSALLADYQVCMRGNLCRSLWLMGQSDEALTVAREAVMVGIDHNGVSLCLALAFGAIPVALWCGQHVLARAWVYLLREHGARYGLLYWSSWGENYQRLLDSVREPVTFAWPVPVGWPLQADVMVTLHDAPVDGAALRRARNGQAPWSAPEVLRRAAHRDWLALEPGDGAGLARVRGQLEEALQLAREQGALGWQLRCATSLARLMASQGEARHAHALLAGIHGAFTQGHASADLLEALALLEELRVL